MEASEILTPAPTPLDAIRRQRQRRQLVVLIFGICYGWLFRDATGA